MNFFCRLFGHKWIYYRLWDATNPDVRVCKRCHNMFNWKVVFPFTRETKAIWMYVVRYKEFGAKQEVRGYGE